ncbi:MAG: hypothetical protein J2P21_22020, partial [Chloracidobacterium sp.]|nr:hypothetical protein [Chloracidobacterium sp.]
GYVVLVASHRVVTNAARTSRKLLMVLLEGSNGSGCRRLLPELHCHRMLPLRSKYFAQTKAHFN